MSATTVVITGGTQGLGFGYARECLKRGCRVVISGRERSRVEAAVQRLREAVPEAASSIVGTTAEIADLASVQALWDFAAQQWGRVDIWLHNAGYARTRETFLNNSSQDN